MEQNLGGAEQRKKKRGEAVGESSLEDSEDADVERLLGIAMGCMGMSMDDFYRCAPSEFYEAYGAWGEMQERMERSAWERMRMQCLCSLQPYSSKKLRADDLMRFPWEEGEAHVDTSEREQLSHEELMERYRKAKERAGLA